MSTEQTTNDFRDELESLCVDCDVMGLSERSGLPHRFLAGGKFREYILRVLEQFKGNLPPKDDFLKIVGDMYDKYVAPFDIPFIPNFIEPQIDALIKEEVLTLAGKLYDRFASK